MRVFFFFLQFLFEKQWKRRIWVKAADECSIKVGFSLRLKRLMLVLTCTIWSSLSTAPGSWLQSLQWGKKYQSPRDWSPCTVSTTNIFIILQVGKQLPILECGVTRHLHRQVMLAKFNEFETKKSCYPKDSVKFPYMAIDKVHFFTAIWC